MSLVRHRDRFLGRFLPALRPGDELGRRHDDPEVVGGRPRTRALAQRDTPHLRKLQQGSPRRLGDLPLLRQGHAVQGRAGAPARAISRCAGSAPSALAEGIECPYCGAALNLVEGARGNCGQHVDLPALAREVMAAVRSARAAGVVTSGPVRVHTTFRISRSVPGLVLLLAGVFVLFVVKPPFTLQAPPTALHVLGMLMLVAAGFLIASDKFKGAA